MIEIIDKIINYFNDLIFWGGWRSTNGSTNFFPA